MYTIFFWWSCLLWVIHRCGVKGEKPRWSQRQSFIQETSLSLLQCRLNTELQAFSNSKETLPVSGSIMLNKILEYNWQGQKKKPTSIWNYKVSCFSKIQPTPHSPASWMKLECLEKKTRVSLFCPKAFTLDFCLYQNKKTKQNKTQQPQFSNGTCCEPFSRHLLLHSPTAGNTCKSTLQAAWHLLSP